MSGRVLPTVTPDTAPYWEAARRHELRLQRCAGCDAFRFPPGPSCPRCGSPESRWTAVSGRGEVYSYVVVHRATHPAFEHDVPYAVVLVEIHGTGGVRVPARLVGCAPEEVRIGMPVEVDFDDAAPGVTLPVFRTAGAPGR